MRTMLRLGFSILKLGYLYCLLFLLSLVELAHRFPMETLGLIGVLILLSLLIAQGTLG